MCTCQSVYVHMYVYIHAHTHTAIYINVTTNMCVRVNILYQLCVKCAWRLGSSGHHGNNGDNEKCWARIFWSDQCVWI